VTVLPHKEVLRAMNTSWLRRSVWLWVLALIAAGCRGAALMPPTAVPTAPPGPQAVPAGATTIKQLRADLDGDGSVEEVTVYQEGQQLSLAIEPSAGKGLPWRTALPAGASFISLDAQDIDADRRPEVLVETSGPEANTYNLSVARWSAGKGQLLVPEGGPSAGNACFRSLYYRPLIDDLNGDISKEIVLEVDKGDPHFLNTVVYEWGGKGYVFTDLYLMPPRVIPTPTPS